MLAYEGGVFGIFNKLWNNENEGVVCFRSAVGGDGLAQPFKGKYDKEKREW